MWFKGQQGEGRTGFIITLVVVASLFFVGFRVLPVRINAYQFKDVLREEVRYGSANKKDGEVRQRILEQAEEMKIPLDPKNLTIRRTRKELVIRATYEEPIDLKVTTYVYRFDSEHRAPVF